MRPLFPLDLEGREDLPLSWIRMPHSRAENDRQLESANAREVPLRAQSAAKDYTLVEAARLRRHARIFLQSCDRPRRTTRPGFVSAAADVQERCRRAELFSARISRNARRVRIPSRIVVR